ncbi:unnamed protein product, partial [marine sediment metagenome]
GLTDLYGHDTAWQSGKVTNDTFSQAITDLGKGTFYHFRAQARNSAETANGADKTFLTKSLLPVSFSATVISVSRIDLSWAKGTGANRTMLRRKTGDYPVDYNDGTQVYFDTGTSKSDTELSPGTTYYYRAWSEITFGGLTQWSDNYAQDSKTTFGPPTCQTNNAVSVEETTATLNGEVINDEGETCQYQFQWGLTDSYGNSTGWTGSVTTGQSFSENISSLSGATTYHFRAELKNSGGTGSGEDKTFLTKPAAPTWKTPNYLARTASSITWQWNSVSGATGYKMDIGEVYTDLGDVTSHQEPSLTPNTQYTRHLKSYNASGDSLASAGATAYTLANIPSNLSLTADSTSQITASWSANSNPSGTEYYAENTTANTNSGWTINSSWSSSGLSCGTSYTFKVKARNGDREETSFSDTFTITTQACPVTGGGGLPPVVYNP